MSPLRNSWDRFKLLLCTNLFDRAMHSRACLLLIFGDLSSSWKQILENLQFGLMLVVMPSDEAGSVRRRYSTYNITPRPSLHEYRSCTDDGM